MISFKELQEHAKNGEFGFGSNHHCSVEKETGIVSFNSHGLEYLEYKSLEDFYTHYFLEQGVEHKYSALFANYDDETEIIEFHDPTNKERLKGVDIDVDGSDIFSDLVTIKAEHGYSQRTTILQYKGIALN
jgi:hypothetical protein